MVISTKRDVPFEAVRDRLPAPIFDADPGFLTLYWKAWEMAWDHVMDNPSAPQSPYMDEAWGPDRIWIWDTLFMTAFCRYAPAVFPGIESLSNLYAPIWDDIETGLKIHHPDNPPFFAWVEHLYVQLTGDVARLEWLLHEKQYLQKHWAWVEQLDAATQERPSWAIAPLYARAHPYGFQWTGVASGMDNTPRGRDNPEEMLWVDLLGQQALAAEQIAVLASSIGDAALEAEWRAKYAAKRDLLNAYYWDPVDGIYYDVVYPIDDDGNPASPDPPVGHIKVKTPAAYWPMLAGVPTAEQAEALARHAGDPKMFGGPMPWPSVARDDPAFEKDGLYWRGGIWLPTAYMATKALDRYGYHAIAAQNADALLRHMWAVYNNVEFDPETGELRGGDLEMATIWEAYSPTEPLPATHKSHFELSRPHFCGWSALGPIALFIEDVLGFHTINALTKTIQWRRHQTCHHGIKNLTFGNVTTDIKYMESGTIRVRSNAPYTLEVNGSRHAITPGTHELTPSS